MLGKARGKVVELSKYSYLLASSSRFNSATSSGEFKLADGGGSSPLVTWGESEASVISGGVCPPPHDGGDSSLGGTSGTTYSSIGWSLWTEKKIVLYSVVSSPLGRSNRFTVITLHPLADMFIPTPTRLLLEGF